MDRAAVHGSEHSRQSGHSRQSVLAPLARQLAGVALRRTGLAAALWGEAGIGKTHACQEVLRGLICRSVSVHAASGFGALVMSLPRPRTLSAWLEQSLGRLQSGQEAGSADPLAVFSGLLAACAPIILHIEDLHEASGEQLAFWQGLNQLRMSKWGEVFRQSKKLSPHHYLFFEPANEALLGYLIDNKVLVLLNVGEKADVFSAVDVPTGKWKLVGTSQSVNLQGVRGQGLTGGKAQDLKVGAKEIMIWVKE